MLDTKLTQKDRLQLLQPVNITKNVISRLY